MNKFTVFAILSIGLLLGDPTATPKDLAGILLNLSYLMPVTSQQKEE